MTKTLTEQWRDGKLPDGCYYAKFYTAKTPYIEVYGSGFLKDLAEFNGTDRAEVLAPVPSYDEFVQQRDFVKDHQKVLIENMNLKRKLEIATKALKEINKNYRFTVAQDVVYKALKKIKEVK